MSQQQMMDEAAEDAERRDDGDQNTDIDFLYNDTDEFGIEIAELYSYSEESEFLTNKISFEEDFSRYVSTKWFETSTVDQRTHIRRLLDNLESGKREVRRRALRAILYIVQGNFADWGLEEDQIAWSRRNVYLCIEMGVMPAIIQMLLLETEYDKWSSQTTNPEGGAEGEATEIGEARNAAQSTTEPDAGYDVTGKPAPINMTHSMDLRVVLSVLYTLVETVRDGMRTDYAVCTIAPGSTDARSVKDAGETLYKQFCEELAAPILNDGETTLAIVLFGMVHRFCSGLAPHFPMKKVLLLLWKTLLITLGPITTLFEKKNKERALWKLPPLSENPHEVIRHVRAISPPGTSADQTSRTPRTNNRHTAYGEGKQIPRQGSLANGRVSLQQHYQQQARRHSSHARSASSFNESMYLFAPTNGQDDNVPAAAAAAGSETPRPGSPVSDKETYGRGRNGADTPMPGAHGSNAVVTVEPGDTLPPNQQQHQDVGIPNIMLSDLKVLPWKPKVRKKDLLMFLSNARMKFVRFDAPNDMTSLIGLPEPIHEAVRVMREHLYVSLSEVQIQREDDLARNPFSMGHEAIPETAVERIYRTTYMQLPQYMIALLRVLLAAAPTSRAKTEPINILAEVMPEIGPSTVVQSAVLNFDISRHRELIVKAISAILLLLLKHLKLNHVYQFEYVSQYLVFANCIPLILKFFNQDTRQYVLAKNTLNFLEFPSRFLGEMTEVTSEMLVSDWSAYCWRNLFACINLLRILNMLTKWKPSRTLLLVVLKSASILRRALRVRHAMMQLYVLKLLKIQSRYFGRQWRKNNMSIMSAIYQKVRHRLTDDWAYGSDVDATPWRLQFEESTLRTSVEQFNCRRYSDDWMEPEFRPVDNCLTSVLNQPFELSDEFKRNYEKWLEEEVFSVPINWSQVLAR